MHRSYCGVGCDLRIDAADFKYDKFNKTTNLSAHKSVAGLVNYHCRAKFAQYVYVQCLF